VTQTPQASEGISMRSTCLRATSLLVLSLLAPAAVAAQEPASPTATATPVAEAVERAPVVVDGRRLFVVAGVTAFPAAKRAAFIADGIRDLARDPAFDPATLTVVEEERETRIMAGERRLFRLFDVDAEIEGVDRRILAEVCVTATRQAIVDYRAVRTPDAVRAALWKAAVASLVGLGALVLAVLATRAIDRRLARRFRDRVKSLTISSFELVRAERLWGVVRGAVRLPCA